MKRFAIVFALLVPVLVSGCSRKVIPANRVADSAGVMSVETPTGWTADKSGIMGTKFLLTGPMTGSSRARVNLTTGKCGAMSLEEYKTVSLAYAAKTVAGYQVAACTPATIDGVPGYRMEYSGNMGTTPRPLRFRVYLTIKNGTAYVLTCAASAQDFNQNAPIFDAVAASWKWE